MDGNRHDGMAEKEGEKKDENGEAVVYHSRGIPNLSFGPNPSIKTGRPRPSPDD